MKKQLNAAIAKKRKQKQNVGEVALFQEMAKIFDQQKGVNATYVKEVHKQIVEYDSNYYIGKKRVELGDLLFLTYSRAKKQIKLCVMQVKFTKETMRADDCGNIGHLKCKGDLYQWELLLNKPDVSNVYESGKWIPKNILNFRTDYKSITEYGIFYFVCDLQGKKEIDFQCIPPEYFCPMHIPSNSKLQSNIQKGRHEPKSKTFCDVRDINSVDVSKYLLFYGPEDAIIANNLNEFADHIVSWRVGAPIEESHVDIKDAVCNMLRSMRGSAENPAVIDSLLKDYIGDDGNLEKYIVNVGKEPPMGHPAAVVVVLGEEEEKEGEKV